MRPVCGANKMNGIIVHCQRERIKLLKSMIRSCGVFALKTSYIYNIYVDGINTFLILFDFHWCTNIQVNFLFKFVTFLFSFTVFAIGWEEENHPLTINWIWHNLFSVWMSQQKKMWVRRIHQIWKNVRIEVIARDCWNYD